MGVTVSTYIQHENGTRGFPASRAAKYGRFFRVAPEWLLYGRGSGEPLPPLQPELTALPLIGLIQAGAWLEVDDSGQAEPETIPVALDRRYPHARQWLREVQGDSMNARGIHSGDLAHIVDFVQAGIALVTGQVVEVTRYRAGGALREVTLKEVELVPDGILLWPRSTNPAWRDPIKLDDDSGQDIEVQVTGLLLAAIRRF